MVQTWRLRKVLKMSSVCTQLIVVAVTLSLSDVACQTVHNISISDDVHSGRQRRQAQPLTQQQISEIVQHHNDLRRREGAADMELMVWNTSLASLAATWAATCRRDHPSGDYGQNIMRAPENKINVTSLVNHWYNEKPNYKGVELECVPGEKCLHYTQVVWANSRSIGCALHRCSPHSNLVCNYWPTGNTKSYEKDDKRYPAIVYKRGPACSKCSNGAGWCKNRLCNRNCSSAGEGCSCAAICYNCATLDLESCRCNCVKRWYGADCSVRCIDTNKKCNTYLWPKSFCDGHPRIRIDCPIMCGLCEGDPDAKEGQCPPVRAPGAYSAQTKFFKSHQSTMIFVMVIIAFTISSYDAL